MSESDGIEEALEGQLRVALTTAARTGEMFARERERAARRAEADSQQEARELRSRVEAEHRGAHAELSNVYRPEWWDRASQDDVARTYQVATTWSREDPEAARAEQRIREEVRTRYGVNMEGLGEHHGRAAETEQARAQQDRAEAERLVQDADRTDRDADQRRDEDRGHAGVEDEPTTASTQEPQQGVLPPERGNKERAEGGREEAAPAYDSAERREATAEQLRDQGVDERTVGARMRADASQAKPATEATATSSTSPRARKGRGQGPEVQIERSAASR